MESLLENDKLRLENDESFKRTFFAQSFSKAPIVFVYDFAFLDFF